MKKCISIGFLFVILVSQYGHYCFYALQEMKLKKEFKARVLSRLPDSSLERIEENSRLIWKEEGKEFFLDGELYDIVRTEIINGKKYYYVLNDHLEKKLVNEFNHVLKSHQENSKSGKLSFKFHFSVFTLTQDVIINGSVSEETRKYFIPSSGILTLPRSIIPKPPRYLFS